MISPVLQERDISFYEKSDKHTVTPNAPNVENIDDLKAQMLEMQMEIDILKETIFFY